jgi:methylglyoxal synthase
MKSQDEKKTFVAILASHDSQRWNNRLAELLEELYTLDDDRVGSFHFVMTGGTFMRVLIGSEETRQAGFKTVNEPARSFLIPKTTSLPSRTDGGVTILSYLVVQRQCSIMWPFLDPLTAHSLNPENLALMRLCDTYHVKRLMNYGSVKRWFIEEADKDASRNPQECPLSFRLGGSGIAVSAEPRPNNKGYVVERPKPDWPDSIKKMRVALIAHDEMKSRMVEFTVDYERKLGRFGRILATGTTGREVTDAARSLEKQIYRYHSGPKGGDIEIATEVLCGECHVVIFFVDTLHPHPHIEDIRTVFSACMIEDKVRMFTHEMQAREWMGSLPEVEP